MQMSLALQSNRPVMLLAAAAVGIVIHLHWLAKQHLQPKLDPSHAYNTNFKPTSAPLLASAPTGSSPGLCPVSEATPVYPFCLVGAVWAVQLGSKF